MVVKLGLDAEKYIEDVDLLNKMENLIFHDGDVRPVWIGGGYANTNNSKFSNFAKWANEHWALYYSFINDIEKLSNCTVLDLGCGSGFCTANLNSIFKNSNIIGIDIDQESINFCNMYNKNNNINYIAGNVITEKMPEVIDYIFLIETLEHIKHQHHYELIDKLLNMLSDTGKLFISTPNEEKISNSEKGHIGILTNKYFTEFKEKYKNNIISIQYLNNKKLVSGEEYITNNNKDSHFKIEMKK